MDEQERPVVMSAVGPLAFCREQTAQKLERRAINFHTGSLASRPDDSLSALRSRTPKSTALSPGLFIDMFMSMLTTAPPRPRLLRAANPPLGSYFRAGRDHKSLQALLAADRSDFSGVVLEAQDHARHQELHRAAHEQALETVLDTKAFELSTVRGPLDPRLASLPWAGADVPHTPLLLRGDWGKRVAELVADEVAARRYTAVLAPTHLLNSADDPWLSVDLEVTEHLRNALDRRQLREVTIYFPLTLHSKVFHSPVAREALMSRLAAAPIDAVWLRIHPFSASTAGPLVLRNYIKAARDLQRLQLPIVGERTGTAGLALMAFGAIGGIESGITHGERFVTSGLFKAPDPDSKPFAPPPRIYLSKLGVFVSRAQHAALMEKSTMKSAFGCRDSMCCSRGTSDTDRDPRRHFLFQRLREVNEISRRPEPVRAGVYLEDFLRPATDLAVRAAKVDPAFDRYRERLDGWRIALGAVNQDGPPAIFAKAPEGKRTHPNLRETA
jgi:hypothetical protein